MDASTTVSPPRTPMRGTAAQRSAEKLFGRPPGWKERFRVQCMEKIQAMRNNAQASHRNQHNLQSNAELETSTNDTSMMLDDLNYSVEDSTSDWVKDFIRQQLAEFEYSEENEDIDFQLSLEEQAQLWDDLNGAYYDEEYPEGMKNAHDLFYSPHCKACGARLISSACLCELCSPFCVHSLTEIPSASIVLDEYMALASQVSLLDDVCEHYLGNAKNAHNSLRFCTFWLPCESFLSLTAIYDSISFETQEEAVTPCPICRSEALVQEEDAITCSCGLRADLIYEHLNLEYMHQSISEMVTQHAQHCPEHPVFVTEEQSFVSFLVMHCNVCGTHEAVL